MSDDATKPEPAQEDWALRVAGASEDDIKKVKDYLNHLHRSHQPMFKLWEIQTFTPDEQMGIAVEIARKLTDEQVRELILSLQKMLSNR